MTAFVGCMFSVYREVVVSVSKKITRYLGELGRPEFACVPSQCAMFFKECHTCAPVYLCVYYSNLDKISTIGTVKLCRQLCQQLELVLALALGCFTIAEFQ